MPRTATFVPRTAHFVAEAPLFLFTWFSQRGSAEESGVTLSSYAFGFRNGSVDCSANCRYDKVSVLILVTSGLSPEKSSEPSAASSVDLNTSLSVWSNLYLVWLVYEFLCGVAPIEISMGG